MTLRVALAIALCGGLAAQAAPPRVVDVPTRPGVTERILYLAPDKARATVLLFPGGAGDFEVTPEGVIVKQKGNFLVRVREQFVDEGIAVAVLPPPSDRRHLIGFRNSAEHAQDVRAVIAWLRRELAAPVWLIGTSRGTQSAAYVAVELPPAAGGADGLVLTSSILVAGRNQQEPPVPALALERIAVPVLVVHHRQDNCRSCPFGATSQIMRKLDAAPRKELAAFEGGVEEGDACEPFAHHGYNGIERDVVKRIADWIAPR